MIKKVFLMLGIAAMLASCSQNEELFTDKGNNTVQQVTFTLATDEKPQTRATTDGLRYVVAVYDEAGTTEVKQETTFANNSFTIMLPPGTYKCLFWADYGSTNYDATDLTSVKDLKSTEADANAEAFYASQSVEVSNGNQVNVTLDRAVAKVILRETDVLEPGSMTVTYSRPTSFNVADGKTTGTESDTKTLSIENEIHGTTDSPVEIGSFYVLASSDEANLDNFITKYNEEEKKTISNVPVQANYQTYITGKYGTTKINQQFLIDVNTTWNTSNKEGKLLNVNGDYTLVNNSGSYDCIVLSSTGTSAIIACKTKQAEAENKEAAAAKAEAIGGRLVTFAEFELLCNAGIVEDSYADYYCSDDGRCYYLHGTAGHDGVVEPNLEYYVAFDITK
ncbi:hypothetical protein [Prevotella sp. SGI.167]|uniref:hypothetical protein n=1 Tax=Prevotella sp. SGI.167 TaxID=3420566 RepID=UPI004040A918